MTLTVLHSAAALVTMDDDAREIADGAIAWRNGVITAIGTTEALASLRRGADRTIDARDCVVTPGLVNTHHHLFQSLTRAVPGATDASLFGWLRRLYPIWTRYRPDDVHAAARLGLAELALSGCTLSTDHLYLYPNGVTLDDTIAAAGEIGLRFHPTRGSMSVGESAGGLPPDALVEREPAILADTIRVIDRFHDPAPGAMVRIGVAPCSPFSVSEGLMRDAALLARDKGVMLHTHLAEDEDDVAFSLARFGCRPGVYAERLGWTGRDVWMAHAVKLDVDEIALFAATGTGVAHCPCSNCRLGSGIAPIRQMLAAGVPLGLGVDGSASNDSGNLLQEARQALLLQRVTGGAEALSARAALRLATRGGAEILGRHDCGALTVGRRADLAVWDVATAANTGAWDPVDGLVLCPPAGVRDLVVEGRTIISGGELRSAPLPAILDQARQSIARLRDR
ncbi:cytosine/adenosine deaminase-related metal-dependent hydrolase [Sphingomonas sp. SORGH_AS802]|uniref:8-oxoguanine deaminase n=1 Tax=unclassified Sphingomonas TaxID=196159 RepID=UPI00286697E2|nr:MULTISPECIES: 8-oxoguanine deaminase [unclassified Sphingomonas]MDR6126843.1 cytosine/adenosine deaminase-related metal-dependent hydrolase [Sphingomonas sp. SORGH_AS_0438]MDR6134795.1 cytosine/adenosine deaminase-related metal-dependent hydrolase [Sphingomonas sp. SORGH_AS_0802]